MCAFTTTELPRVCRGKLLIFGGIYGNWQALQAVIAVGRDENIPLANTVITGDLIAYCTDGGRVAAFCQTVAADAVIVRGNCERTLSEEADDCDCGFANGSICRLLSDAWYAHAQRDVSPPLKTWMGKLPPRADICFANRRLAVIHAGANADNDFIFASTPNKAAHLDALGVDGIIAGHCGIPFSEFLADGRCWHNSGALGMPANDGTPRTWYAVWEETPNGIRIRHRALCYQHIQTICNMQTANLPNDYQRTLSSGIWPSDSILPKTEKQQQGTPLPEKEHLWAT